MIICVTGPMFSGKTTVADYLVEKHGFKKYSFATPLKEMAAKVTFDGKIDKARDRELLQFLGTNYYRKLKPTYWVDKWMDNIHDDIANGKSVVADDCRFENEAYAAYSLGGHIIKLVVPEPLLLERGKARDGNVNPGLLHHASEAEIPLESMSNRVWYIYNEFDTATLFNHVNVILQNNR